MKTPPKIEEECAFSTEQMSAASDVENDAVAPIGCGEWGITITPCDELRQSIGSNGGAKKLRKRRAISSRQRLARGLRGQLIEQSAQLLIAPFEDPTPRPSAAAIEKIERPCRLIEPLSWLPNMG